MNTLASQFGVETLGKAEYPSPLNLSNQPGDSIADFVDDNQFVLPHLFIKPGETIENVKKENLLELAGPREKLFFKADEVHAGVITCGGLCPGLNDVIRSIVLCLWHQYGVRKISGIQYGFRGLIPEYNLPVVPLTPDVVSIIHQRGGTMLGSSRGEGERPEIIETLQALKINMLFVIGGDGTQRGALKLAQDAKNVGYELAVVGVPKTIDNDISFIQKSFGFETAVSLAVNAVAAAHIEARNAMGGIGLVKVMGRESGFIAAHTALANSDVNFCLIPEVPFDLEGKNGLFALLQKRLDKRRHALIVAAEGAGQKYLEAIAEKDASGNKKLGDIGHYLSKRIKEHFNQQGTLFSLKYIDPSYMIRSAPANPSDSIYCARLGSNAVHAAMAGKSEILIGQLHNQCIHLPIRVAVAERNVINPESAFWRDVINGTGQPIKMYD